MKDLLKDKFFLFGLFIKVVFLFVFGSELLFQLFVPFLDYWANNPLSNPWSHFELNYFPYGSILLLILGVPRVIATSLLGPEFIQQLNVSLFLIKAPLLFFDILLLLTLKKLAPERLKSLIFYYWLNPVLFYITYYYVQLDVVAITFVALSIANFVNYRSVAGIVFLAFATLCKFHVVILLPFFLLYIWNHFFAKEALTRIGRALFLYGFVVIAGLMPNFMSQSVGHATFFSPQALRVFNLRLQMGDSDLFVFVGFAVLLLVLGRLILSFEVTKKGLVLSPMILFGTLLIITNPGEGWFFWVLPFMSLFYATHNCLSKLFLFNVYFFYFSHFLKPWEVILESIFLEGISLTLLLTSLFVFLVAAWIRVVEKEMPIHRRKKPLTIGIAGDSGSGKNFLSEAISLLFSKPKTIVIEGDDYHKWERGNENWWDYTHLNPKANFLDSMYSHARKLEKGEIVYQRHYNHDNGRFTEPKEIAPANTLVVQGLHALYLKGFERALDIKVFLEPDYLVRLKWKLERDTVKRGHSKEKVISSLRSRIEDSKAHIAPQKNQADILITVHFADDAMTEERVIDGQSGDEYIFKYYVWNDCFLGDLVVEIDKLEGCSARLDHSTKDLRSILVIQGNPGKKDIERIANKLFNLRIITKSWARPILKEGQLGVQQLLISAFIRSRGDFLYDY